MKVDRIRHEAALVILWPQTVPMAAARDAAQRLTASRVPATWCVDQASQIQAIASWSASRSALHTALIVSPAAANLTSQQDASQEVSRRLELLRESGVAVDIVCGGAELAGGHWPRHFAIDGRACRRS